MTSIGQQSLEELGGSRSLLVRQRRDRADLDRLLDEVTTTTGQAQDEVLNQLARLVFPHAYGEETVLWPALRRLFPDGHDLTLANEQEHQQINVLFGRIDAMSSHDSGRALLVENLVELLRQDVRTEEDELLPRLQHALTAQQLRRLGLLWEAVRRTAPTRPHAVVSRRPPGNLVAGLPLAALDRTRDGLHRVARAFPATAGVSRRVSRRIATLAGALEHLPPMSRGEDARTAAR